MAININEEQSVEILTKIFTDAGIEFRKKEPNEEGGFFYKENGVLKKFTGNIFVKRSFKYDRDFLLSRFNMNDLFNDGGSEEVESNIGIECEPTVSNVMQTTLNASDKDEIEKNLVSFSNEQFDVFDCDMPITLDVA